MNTRAAVTQLSLFAVMVGIATMALSSQVSQLSDIAGWGVFIVGVALSAVGIWKAGVYCAAIDEKKPGPAIVP